MSTSFLGSPANPPNISYHGDGTASAPAIAFGSETTMGMYRIGTSLLGLSTASTERIRIDANGKIGVNTTNTTGNYQMRIDASNRLGISVFSTAAASAAYFNLENDSANIWQMAAMGSGTAAPNNLQINYNATTLLNWTQNSNVIFNHTANTNGQSQFQFVNAGTGYGSFTASNTGAGVSLQVGSAGTAASGNWFTGFPVASSNYIQANAGVLVIQTAGNFGMAFGTNSAIALTLTSSQRVLLASNGSAASPAIAFGTETSSGLYFITGGQWAASAQGTISAIFTVNGLQANTGAVGTPAYSFAADTSTGMYRSAANTIAWATNGVQRMFLNTTSLQQSVDHTPVADITNDLGNSSHRWLNIWGQTIHSGDVQMENDWRITEGEKVGHPEEGIMFLSPEGKKYKISMTEVE